MLIIMEITRLKNSTEAKICAKMMADSEPWITLKRDFKSCLEIILDPSREVYIAKNQSEILGFIIIEMEGAFIGYIKSIYTTPKKRGSGVGSKLLKFAEDRILRDTPNVFICVSNFNIDAQRFYQRQGYEIIGELTNYIISGSSEILMRKTIAPLSEF